MRRASVFAALTGLLLGRIVDGQATEASLSFEVASVRLAAPSSGGLPMGAGSTDPGRVTYRGVTFKNLLITAFGVRGIQISGPSWIEGQRFDIAATLPAGTTKEQLNLMLQNLLTERFGMTLHHESREFAVYDLTVSDRGTKLKESSSAKPDGIAARTTNGVTHLRSLGGAPIGILAKALEGSLGVPVLDKTGLGGNFDFILEFASEKGVPSSNDDPAPSASTAVQESLGLKLTRTKAALDVLVIDHVEKTPSEN